MVADFSVEASSDPLDLFSTSPTRYQDLCCPIPEDRCKFGAPFFAFQRGGLHYGVVQGCCNHWECPRCGVMVAKQHYGRIVEGARTLSKDHELWFITITCRGKEISESEATKNYLSWSSKFLDSAYAKSKRAGKVWAYVQVTEKQKRGHPHSHILTTFCPGDITSGLVADWKTDTDGVRRNYPRETLRSEWVQSAVVRAGLGDQYDISQVREIEGAARYVAKYMFKESQFSAHFPKHWKRVRYSQSWPKLPVIKTDAFVLLGSDDWRTLAQKAAVVDAEAGDAFEAAEFYLSGSDTIVYEKKGDKERGLQNSTI